MASSETPTTETETSVAPTSWKHELPYVNRPKPRAHGTGQYGVSRYDDRDDTRYAWGRVVPAVTAFLLALVLVTPARATSNTYCESADELTSTYGLCKPAVDVEGSTPWGTKFNENWDIIEEALASVGASPDPKVTRTGDTMTGALKMVNTSFQMFASQPDLVSGLPLVDFTDGSLVLRSSAGFSESGLTIYPNVTSVFTVGEANIYDPVHNTGVTLFSTRPDDFAFQYFGIHGSTIDFKTTDGNTASDPCQTYGACSQSDHLMRLNWDQSVDIGTGTPSKFWYGSLTVPHTVTADVFVGDGSHLTGINAGAQLTSTQTFSGGNTFASSVTFNGSVLGTINASTQTILRANFITANTMPVCYASTITFTTQAVRLRITLSGGELTAPNASTDFNILLDGGYLSPYSSSIFMQKYANAENSGSTGVFSINYMVPAVSAGSHSICLSGDSTASNGVDCSVSPCVLRVEEVR